jgi:hypothetical protein
MVDDRDSYSTPNVVRLGGGRSARAGAVVVAAALVTVVWIGLSGRSAPPTIPPQTSAVAVAPSPSTEPTSTALAPSRTAPPIAVAAGSDEVFGVFAVLGDNQYIAILAEPDDGHLTGSMRVPIPPPATQGTFVFQQLSAPSARGQPVMVGRWPLRVESLVAASGREFVVVNESEPPRRTLLNAPRPVLRGYHIEVRAQSGVISGEITIDIRLGPNQRIIGDDGIYGWPTVALIPVDEPIAVIASYPRERGRYNYCRWDLSPLSAPPRPGTDEADC